MAKVSTTCIQMRVKDQRKSFYCEVHYSSPSSTFFCRFPPKVEYSHIEDSLMYSFGLEEQKAKGHFGKHLYWKTSGKSEGDAIDKMKTVLNKFFEATFTERKVICIMYSKESHHIRNEETLANKNFDPVELAVSFQYLTEVKVDGSTFYRDEKSKKRMPFYFDRSGIVLDDTPENRAFIEHVHKNITSINGTLSKWLNKDFDLQKAIASKAIKLLGI